MTAQPTGAAPVRVLVCDDHRLFADALALALDDEWIEVVAVVDGPAAALEFLERDVVDVCVVDRWFPEEDGLELVAAIGARHPEVRVLVCSGSVDPGLPAAAFAAGATGFATKEVGVERLGAAIARTHMGERVEDRGARRANDVEHSIRLVTNRERAVLAKLVEGCDTASLARDLGISYPTARTHIQNLLTKLGLHSKLELVAFAVEHGLASPFGTR